MTRGAGAVVLLVLTGLVLAVVARPGRSGSESASGPAPTVHQIEIVGFEFMPAHVEVAPGDTVVWTNRDFVPHTATAAGSWDSGELADGDGWRWVVTGRGRVSYLCNFHPSMKGELVIR